MDERTYEQQVQDTTSHFYPATPSNEQIQWEVDQAAEYETVPDAQRCPFCNENDVQLIDVNEDCERTGGSAAYCLSCDSYYNL